MRVVLVLISMLLCLPLGLAAQAITSSSEPGSTDGSKPVHLVGLDVRPGYVFPTHSFFRGDNASGKPVNPAMSAHLRYAFRFASGSRWGQLYPHAYQGIGVGYNTFGNRAELGNPVSVYVFQGSRLARLARNLTLNYEWNFGASFGWKKYDEEANHYNDIVGSRINAFLNVGFFVNWQLAPQWGLTAGVDLSHYSNGNTNYPNAGVNTVTARVGVVRSFGGQVEAEDVLAAGRLIEGSRFSYDLVLYGSTRKRGIMWSADDGDLIPGSFGVAGLNFNPMYRVNKYFRAGVSLDAQYDESANLKDHLVEGTGGEDIKFYRPPFREQFAVGLSLRAELTMPVFSVNLGVGRNVFYKGKDIGKLYQILALKAFVTRRLFLHVGYQLSNFHDPNNLMLGLGYRFGGS